MTTLCAWCNKTIVDQDDEDDKVAPISHGICKKCAKIMFSEVAESLDTFLERFNVPILVIDAAENVLAANKRALARASLKAADLPGMRCGDVLQCINATDAAGCGRTVHCHSCVIRNSVLHTQATGLPVVQVPSFPDLQQFTDKGISCLLISTEKIGEIVLLKIEESAAKE